MTIIEDRPATLPDWSTASLSCGGMVDWSAFAPAVEVEPEVVAPTPVYWPPRAAARQLLVDAVFEMDLRGWSNRHFEDDDGSHCSVGALMEVDGGNYGHDILGRYWVGSINSWVQATPAAAMALGALAQATGRFTKPREIAMLRHAGMTPWHVVSGWNDGHGTSEYGDVRATFLRAIEALS